MASETREYFIARATQLEMNLRAAVVSLNGIAEKLGVDSQLKAKWEEGPEDFINIALFGSQLQAKLDQALEE